MPAMAETGREQALALLAAANNHGDLSVKLSSLKQAKDILLSVDASVAVELLPYLIELQTSPQSLVRISLIKAMEEIGSKAMEDCYVRLVPVLLTFLQDSDTNVAKQSIVSGTNLFCRVLEGLAMQLHRHGKIERWLEEIWIWMAKFKDAIIDIALRPGSIGTRLLGMKFLETFVLLFTSDNNSEKPPHEGIRGSKWVFNISWLGGGLPILDPVSLMSESNRCLGILLDLLRSSSSLSSTLTIAVVNCLAAIARKRPIHYNTVLSALLDFGLVIEKTKSGHIPSVQYSLRTAFLGFLRCPHPVIVESRDRLLRALRVMNAGDAADQVTRQVDKMMRNNERVSRDVPLAKDDQSYSQPPILGDRSRKRSLLQDSEQQINGHEVASKRSYYGPNNHLASQAQSSDLGQDHLSDNGLPSDVPMLDSALPPIEQMIAMIAALLSGGERGVKSLELLISNMQPDLLADIVITNMKQLPKSIQLSTKLGNLPVICQIDTSSSPAQVVPSTGPSLSLQSSVITAQVASSLETAVSTSTPDSPVFTNSDSKRDPRRDPRRLDPRRAPLPAGSPLVEGEFGVGQSEGGASISLSKPDLHGMTTVEKIPVPSTTKSEDEIVGSQLVSSSDTKILEEDIVEQAKVVVSTPESSSDNVFTVCTVGEGLNVSSPSEVAETDGADALSFMEYDQLSPAVSNTSASEEACNELPPLPLYVQLTDEQKMNVKKLAIARIVDSGKISQWTGYSQTRMGLLARLAAQMDANEDVVVMLQKNIISDYRQQKGHELVLQVLYHLHAVVISESVEHSSFAAVVYEKFLLAVVRSLLLNLPASDKSFSRLLGEVPLLPDSALKLVDDLCCADIYNRHGKEIRNVDCVIQGLGVVWSLILKRPPYRQACLDIALKCAVHSQDEIRSQAIRLVANKLYLLSYISASIEQFATNKLLSAVDQLGSVTDILLSGSTEQKTEWEGTSISGSEISKPTTSGNDPVKGAQPVVGSSSSTVSRQAQCLISLYFSLCTKKPSLLQLVFEIYGRAPRIVKQAFCRHIPVLVRALGSSCSELLRIISDPPHGSEDLLSEVLKVLTEGTMPSSDLIAIVKHLYETKLKDASILIPMLSSLSKNEVLPIFPRLVDLPLEKFQLALAHILQGSAHTGPALTPSEVLVAIHNINPEKDGLPLKKIMDACSTCFEQRTVFTQQVLVKALNHMVAQIPLPLLFMRTVIQSIDAFPTLVDFVMDILSKLVRKQVWKMPKLWFGFLKCVAQTRPHSFNVLLQLPPPQLESALTKHSSLRGPLADYASHPSRRSSLPRSILMALGISNNSQLQQPQLASSLRPPDASSSVHGAASS